MVCFSCFFFFFFQAEDGIRDLIVTGVQTCALPICTFRFVPVTDIGLTEGTELREDIGVSIKPISVTGTKRIVREAFEYTKAHNRSKVTAVHKANIMKFTDGLFLKIAREVAEEEYPGIEFEDRIVDNLCNQLVSRPEEYD